MLDFRPAKSSGQPRFSLDPVERERARAPVNRRKIWHLISLFAIILVTGWMFIGMLHGLRDMIAPLQQKLTNELHATAMPAPSLAAFPALPSADAVAAEAESAKEILGTGVPPVWVGQPEAVSLAWLKLRLRMDGEQPPVPQRVSGDELALNHVRVGSYILINGSVEDSRPALLAGSDDGWQILILHLDSDQYAEVLAPLDSAGFVKGDVVQASGRYMGTAQLPRAQGSGPVVRLPLVAAHTVSAVKANESEQQWTLHGPWQMPDDIYAEVEDDMLIMQTRPYYYTLGEVVRDLATPRDFENAPKASDKANDIYQDPSAYRGKPFVVQGHVFNAWVDPGVAEDHPFGVDRVVRVILWNDDWGPFTDSRGITTRKLVLRAYEIAAITDQPLPKAGDIITATGRFLRKRAMEIKPGKDSQDDPYRSGGATRAATFFFVTNRYKTIVEPKEPIVGVAGTIFTVIVIVVGFLMLRSVRKDASKVEATAEALRLQRNKRGERRAAERVQAKEKSQAAPPASHVPEPPPPGPQDPPPPSEGGPGGLEAKP